LYQSDPLISSHLGPLVGALKRPTTASLLARNWLDQR
jgi:hypothetical protein